MKLVWRNIWRNRRRAVITMASVFFATFFSVIMMSFNEGTWEKMIENTLRTQTGHIQIHGRNYWDDKVVDNFMTIDAETIAQLEDIDNVENVSPRIETFALAASGTISKGIAVCGVSPEKEKQKSNLPLRLVQGVYLTETDDGILLGEGLGKYLRAGIGDTIALIGQGYQGSSAAQLFVVRGILQLMTPEMDNSMAYITLPATQQFIDMPDGYSGILISIKNNNLLYETMQHIRDRLNLIQYPQSESDTHLLSIDFETSSFVVYSWHFTMERLLQSSESDKAFSKILMYVLYIIVGFGILGTIIMMTNERRREFCMMISLGMSRIRLAAIIAVEQIIMSLLGVVFALAVSLPVTYRFTEHPIPMTGEMADTFLQFGMEPVLPMSVQPFIFTNQMTIILVIALLAVIYPVNKILKLRIANK